jgi:hypothetical protein
MQKRCGYPRHLLEEALKANTALQLLFRYAAVLTAPFSTMLRRKQSLAESYYKVSDIEEGFGSICKSRVVLDFGSRKVDFISVKLTSHGSNRPQHAPPLTSYSSANGPNMTRLIFRYYK